MVRISTRYDKDINKKIFLVRGDESYARSTSAVMTVGNINTGDLKGLKIASITVDLYGTLGRGSVELYDGDEPLTGYSRDIASSTHQITFTNIYLGYNATHTLWVKYTPLEKLCLPCKSSKTSINKPIPSALKVNITKSSGNTQFDGGATVSGTFSIKIGSNNAPNDTDVKMYIDGEYDSTLHPSSGVLSLSKSGLSDGRHTIRFEVDDNTSYWGGVYEYDVYVGYILKIIEYPQVYTSGSMVKASVYRHTGNPVNQSTVSLYRDGETATLITTATTDDGGTATFSNIELGTTGYYYVSYGGSISDTVYINVPIIENITLTATPSVTAKDKPTIISVSTHNSVNDIPVKVSVYSTNPVEMIMQQTLHTINGTASTTYTGTGAGKLIVDAECSEVSDTINITDAYIYWYSSTNKSDKLYWGNSSSTDSLDEYNSYIQLSSKKPSGNSAFIMYTPTGITGSGYAPKSFKFKIAKNPDNITTLKVGAEGSTYDESNLISVPLGNNPKGKTIEI